MTATPTTLQDPHGRPPVDEEANDLGGLVGRDPAADAEEDARGR